MKKSKNVKRKLLSLLTITALCFSGFFMACSDSDDDSGSGTQNQEDTKSDPASEPAVTYTLSADKESVSLYTTDVNKVVAITSNGTAQIKTAPDATIATASITDKSLTITPVAAGSTSIVIEVKEDSSKTLTLPVTVTKDEWVDENTVTLTGTEWWTGSQSSAVTRLKANQSVTYTFKVGADGADCLVEAYDSSATVKYLSTTSQKTAWGVAVTNAGSQETGILKAGNIYSATISYDGTAITVTYKDLGTDGAGNTELFTTSSTEEVTAPVNAHFAAEFGTFYVKTETTGSAEEKDEWIDENTVTLTGTEWWTGSQSSAVTRLKANQSVTYTFKVGADGADCLVEAYDSSATVKYLSTTSQKTAWGVAVTNAGSQETGILKAGNIYSATISYDGTAITVTYKDLGTDGAGNTELFTTSSTEEVTAPVNAHFAAEFGTFYVKTETSVIVVQ